MFFILFLFCAGRCVLSYPNDALSDDIDALISGADALSAAANSIATISTGSDVLVSNFDHVEEVFDNLQEFLSELKSGHFYTPVGALMPFAGTSAYVPSGWLVCDGRSYAASGASTDLQTVLNAASFTTLPDLSGRTVMAVSGSYALASSGGGSTTLSGSQLPAHSHTIDHGHGTGSSAGGFQGIGSAPGGYQLGNGDGWNQGAMAGPLTVTAHSGSSGNGPGSSASVPTIPPYVVLNYIIKN